MQPNAFTKTFERLVKTTGLPRIRLHDLRHTHVSHGLAANVPPKVIADRAGHSAIAITMDLYPHVMPSQDAAAAELIAAQVDAVCARRASALNGSLVALRSSGKESARRAALAASAAA